MANPVPNLVAGLDASMAVGIRDGLDASTAVRFLDASGGLELTSTVVAEEAMAE